MADELRRRGFTLLARNVRLQRGELDVVATRGDRLWFVEVKSRSRRDRGSPHLAVDARKRRALFAAAREYVVRERYRGDFGFLVASVLPRETSDRACVVISVLPISPPEGAIEC